MTNSKYAMGSLDFLVKIFDFLLINHDPKKTTNYAM